METYHQQYVKICLESADLDIRSPEGRLNLFTFYSANLAHFLPFIPKKEHERLFRATIKNQRLCLLDQAYFGEGLPVDILGWDPAFKQTLKEHPGIICTMHSGSYRLINYLLAKEGIPFALVIADHVHEQQVPHFKDLFEKYLPETRLRFINANDPMAALTMFRLLKQGVNLLVYMDGDVGAPLKDKKKLFRVPFLGQHVYARKGIPYLAYKAGTAVYPLFNFRQADGAIHFFHAAPLHKKSRSLEEYIAHVIERVYGQFGSLLLHFPEQWDNWFRLHQQMDTDRCYMQPMMEPTGRFGLFKGDGRYYLLDKHTYKTILLTDDLVKQSRG
ncbi:Lauroyl/myristoyl acyltransferase [bacterium A37T11]|nr:Lauroyl/myristoyl acyltransferase [bacterium A37T11]